MALDGTNAGMLASVADFLNRADLTAVIPYFITLGEGQLNRRLRVRRMIQSATQAISTELIALPDDFLAPLSLTLSTGEDLDNLGPDALFNQKFNNNLLTGKPTSFSVIGSNIQVNPIPNQSYTAVLTYWGVLPPLAQNATNWLLVKHPDAYLQAALFHAYVYLNDDKAVAMDALLSATCNEIQSEFQADGARLTPLTSQVA